MSTPPPALTGYCRQCKSQTSGLVVYCQRCDDLIPTAFPRGSRVVFVDNPHRQGTVVSQGIHPGTCAVAIDCEHGYVRYAIPAGDLRLA